MRVCIVGAGAIGSVIGARLAHAGQAQVSAVTRGETLEALRHHGWRMRAQGKTITGPVHASASAQDLGPQDVVFLTVKAPALGTVAQSLPPLLTPSTIVVPAMNGVPWWFCQGVPQLDKIHFQSIDPRADIGKRIPVENVLGCVLHASARRIEPGLVEETMWHNLLIGEPFGGMSVRTGKIADLLSQAGCIAASSADIRSEIWYKLWGNMTMNPVSAITGATIDRILDDPLVRAFCSAAMREAAHVGEQIGCPIKQSPDDRHEATARLGAFKTSMLQDAEAGRELELDAIVGVVHEIALHLDIATPNIDALLGMTRLFARVRGLYPTDR
ncbi:MAG: 2-dehydropantoate 2-reductase [Rhodospirillales bacterium]|nr:2-dehydropantoate 2-reductase [Rhodospirillales bacterium]